MRRLLLLLSTLFSVNYLFAQPTAIQYDIPSCTAGTYEHTIGKVSSDNVHIISCHKHTNNSEFVWSDNNSTNAIKFDLPAGMYVHDMEILDGVVYFCGTYPYQGGHTGVVGYFNENYFIGGSTTVNYSMFPSTTYESFDKMEVYYDSSDYKIHLTTIGNAYVSPSVYNTGLLVMIISGSTISYFDINIPGNNQYFTDVAVTKQYIVAAGSANCAIDYGLITVVKKNDMSYYMLNPFHELSGNSNSCFYNIKELTGDSVALSTTIYYPSNSTYYTRIHIYDVAAKQFLHTQDFSLANKIMENEMQYFKEDGMLLVLQTNAYPNHNSPYQSIIYRLKAFATIPYTVDLLYDQNAFYYSLDKYQGNMRFIATGELKTNGHTFFIRDKNAQYKSSCFSSNTENVFIMQTPTATGSEIATPPVNNETIITITPQLFQEQVILRCIDTKNIE